MRKIFSYLKDYQRKHFDLKLYLLITLFLIFCFTFNYYFDFEDQVVDRYYKTAWHWLFMFLWHSLPFLGICVILYLTGAKRDWVRSKSFWLKILLGFSILAFDRTFFGASLITDYLNSENYRFLNKCIRWSSSLVTSVIPLMLIYIMMEKDRPRIYYGLALRRFDPKPYFILLGIAVLFIGIGSFFSDIQEYYPRFQYSHGHKFAAEHNLPVWVSALIYELSYGSDFVSVEVFFRGFLIHAFVKVLGGYAVLPMIATYAFLHFGKPMTEAISSVFGGYVLGIISYNSRNVWGGIIIHMGVAWTMELFGYLQRLI